MTGRLLVALFALILAGCPGEAHRPEPDSASGDLGDAAQISDGGPPDVRPPFQCGNNTCEPGEHCANCPKDCGGCQPKTQTFNPVADSYVDEGASTANFGNVTELVTDQSPDQQAVLRFTVTGLVTQVKQAKLRLYVTNESHDGPELYLTQDPWTEQGVTWDNRPKPGGAALHDLGQIGANLWVEVDVTSAINGNGEVSFLLIPTSTNGADFSSREGGQPPELVVTSAGGPPPPDAGVPDGGPPPTVKFSFFAVGDTRSDPTVAQTNFNSMALLDPGAVAVFNAGDITADGKDSQWQDHVGAVSLGGSGIIRLDLTTWTPGSIRYFGLLGNHDVHDSSWHQNWNKYLPGQQGLGYNNTDGVYFAVTYKSAQFIVLDSEHTSSAQTTWLQQELQSTASNPAIKWRFVFFHKPVYPCNYKSPFSKGIPWVREFEKHKVDMVFAGHAHVYERSCAMMGGKCQTGGVVFITTGGGGAGTVDVNPTKKDTVDTDSYDCSQTLVVGKGNWHHYCHAQIDGAKLTFSCYQHNAVTNPEDTLTIVK